MVDLTADSSRLDLRRSPNRTRYLPFRYSLAGVVTVGSQVPLHELDYFRAQWVGNDVDVAVRVGDIGPTMPRSRALLTQYAQPASVRYEEHFGRLGANFRVDFGSKIDVTIGPLLAHSPHVAYTNVVEALLRFVIASRGRMLLHSACIELNGRGVMLSARTDTGKTSTILRLLREQGGHFLSDDMTIVDDRGGAVCFPKPLTISHHTLRAVQADDLTPGEWRRLRLQSRLHSKEGRSLAFLLSRSNVPIMAINAITQILVPPPKYNVDRLVPCDTIGSTRVGDLIFIERGAPELADLTGDEALTQLVLNTEDAYGFPPFQYFAPAVVIGQEDFTDLKRREREVLGSALRNVRVRRLASDNFGWADVIPDLVARGPERFGQGSLPHPAPTHTELSVESRYISNGHHSNNTASAPGGGE